MDRVDVDDAKHVREYMGAKVEPAFELPLESPNESARNIGPGAPTVDEAASQPIELRTIWRGLLEGSFDVIDSFCNESRCFVVLRAAPPEKRYQASCLARKLRLLEAAALGVGQKVSAAEFGIAVSTVSFATRQALSFLGFSSIPIKIPLILVVLAHAARSESPRFGRETRTTRDGKPCSVVSVERPDLSLAARLPPSEYEVTRLFVEGRSHAEIARRRRTSRRTIANQLASVFHRLRISGRSELLNTVVIAGADLDSERFLHSTRA